MGLMNALELPKTGAWYNGTYESVIGDKFEFTLGTQYDHVFGGEVKLLVDPVAILCQGNPIAASLAAMVLGAGGNLDFCFGSNTSIGYVGPFFEVNRAKTYSKDTTDLKAMQDPIDGPTLLTVKAMSVLIAATALALDLAMHFKYPKYGSDSKDDEEAVEGYGRVPMVLKLLSIEITGRLMAILRWLETKALLAGKAEQEVEEASGQMAVAGGIATGVDPPLGIAASRVEASTEDLEQAAEASAGALA